MDSLPVDFEEKVKRPAAVGGVGGYPYSISAKDLMRDFVFVSTNVASTTPAGGTNGLKATAITGQGGHAAKELYVVGLPDSPSSGDMVYYDGTNWVSLAAPSGDDKVLSHAAGIPVWIDGGGTGGNLNFRVDSVMIDGYGGVTTTQSLETNCWRNGLYVGKFIEGEIPTVTNGQGLDYLLASLVGGS